MRHDPHLLIEGCMIACKAMQSHAAYIYIRGEYVFERERMEAAIKQAYEAKLIGKTFGASLNDVVMTTTAGALRRYLKAHNDLPAKPLLAAVPVSLREAGDASANNQVSMVTMTLGTDIADPLERLQAIHAASSATKAMMGRVKTAIPTDFPLFGAPWLISGIASVVARSRLLNVVPPIANIVISNVPGSPVPVYFAGAKLASYYPVSIVVHSMALNVTVQSYAGRLDYGLIACRRAVPDITDLGDYLLAEHQALLALAQAHAAPVGDAPVHDKPKRPSAAKAAPAAPVKTPAKRKLKLVSAKEAAAAPRKRAAPKQPATRRAA